MHPSHAASDSQKLQYDSVAIGAIPSRAASFAGKPSTKLEAKVLVHHKNKEIELLFVALNKLALEGITDNATRFHQPTKYLEVIYQGESIRLFYSGKSALEKFKDYEYRWRLLHGQIYAFLNSDIEQ